MGFYLEAPVNKKKADYFINQGIATEVAVAPAFNDIPADKFLVIVIDNGPFEAAGVIYDQREYNSWISELAYAQQSTDAKIAQRKEEEEKWTAIMGKGSKTIYMDAADAPARPYRWILVDKEVVNQRLPKQYHK